MCLALKANVHFGCEDIFINGESNEEIYMNQSIDI